MMMKNIPEIVLASKSARRKEILTHLGFDPRIIVSDADETVDRLLSPEMLTEELSLRKAEAVKPYVSGNQLVIASDTVVAKDGRIFGKPKDEKNAFDMLSALAGSIHKVVSGACVSYGEKTAVTHDVTFVTFRAMSDDEIRSYIAAEAPYDKAGAYGIQDKASVFVEKIDGDYFNVVGLPVFKLFSLMQKEFGISYFDLLGGK